MDRFSMPVVTKAPAADHTVSASRIAVYTAAFHGYDILFPPRRRLAGVDYLAFADQHAEVPAGWSSRPVAIDGEETGTKANRRIKILCHEYLPKYEYSVYLDSNIRLRGDISGLLSRFIASGAAIGLARHAERSSIAEEARACIELGRITPEDTGRLAQQVESYRARGLPESHVLTDNGVIFRWHRHPQLPSLMEAWWREFETHVHRDQISLPYVIWNAGVQPLYWDWSIRAPNPYFFVYGHRGTVFRNLETILSVWSDDDPRWSVPYRVVKRLRADAESMRLRVEKMSHYLKTRRDNMFC